MLPRWEENKAMSLAILVLIAFLVMFIWVKTDKTIKETAEVGKPVPYEHSIYIEGQGKVTATPDLATVSFTVETRAVESGSAQSDNTSRMNDLMGRLREIGIADKDIKTSYYNVWQDSIWNPETGEYTPGDWVVSQTIDVKVRDTAKTGEVLSLAGEFGATSVTGPNFTLDDPTVYREEAREEAIADAMKKARVIADKLGLKIESVIGYSEYSPDYYPPMPYYSMAAEAMDAKSIPEVSEGETEVLLNVSITFKLAD